MQDTHTLVLRLLSAPASMRDFAHKGLLQCEANISGVSPSCESSVGVGEGIEKHCEMTNACLQDAGR